MTIGDAELLRQQSWLFTIGHYTLQLLDKLFEISLGAIALFFFASQRRQRAYLWIAAAGALGLLELPESLITEFRNIPLHWEFAEDLLRVASPFVWASLYFCFVNVRTGWKWRTFLVFAGVMNALAALDGALFVTPAFMSLVLNLPFICLLSVVIPIVLAVHWRRGNREAGILLIPVLLFSLYIYAVVALDTLFEFPAWRESALRGLALIDRFPAGPFEISLNDVSSILSTISLAVIMILRSTATSRRQAILESELLAAQQVQQVLVPEDTGTFPGFHVESVYLPAQQVGGDFFQVLHGGGGALLVVVGDVAGKGLPAAMLVSALVGALRAIVEFTRDPAELLTHLNERLVGRAGGGFATALAAHIAPDGRVRMANAGHLSPYLDGRELELPGALPLGIAAGASYDVVEFLLPDRGRITFCSDGVIEAQNSKGELFGFDRSRDISAHKATEIADAAMNFGQEDDITVVTVERRQGEASASAAENSTGTGLLVSP